MPVGRINQQVLEGLGASVLEGSDISNRDTILFAKLPIPIQRSHWNMKQSLERLGNFSGAALLVFAASTTMLSPRHNYLLYVLIAAGGVAALLLAHLTEKRRGCRCD